MLVLRPGCETCDTDLPPDSGSAMICSYECTFCSDCAGTLLHNTCPNCGGELVRRPVRPQARLVNSPASRERVYQPLTGERLTRHAALVAQYHGVLPAQR
ncbi:DUF1272 domain-containing protein [Actimicrobium sp. CCC2.4]|uniref:DUF1272 domain-containing protein n=1 Tax=Actimicrobium sp. CCC2.4 TaxID=3048606 RepID=UPI002AC8DC86|nr:DUF1272 domain-containing protein [Actimicrobium sp. CCC2.4]MEB0137222.1 DUF1272 domain-containing protein [Actimicrobium sp. CCC2.4]WPX33510.1 DUF1272 domain-containing protein [Actimicrobium sp. CCC2.4]